MKTGAGIFLLACALLGGCLSTPPAPPIVASSPATAHARCVDPSAFDLRRLLPPPPAAGSAEQRAELDAMLHIQAERSPTEVEKARADAAVSVFRFADALANPPQFDARSLPLTAALFRDLEDEESAVMEPAKVGFARPRPFTAEPRLSPVLERPRSASYPSGHSTWARAAALVLSDMVPERRTQILARASEYAHNRVVAGVHYPSDVRAGELAGTALAAVLFACPQFRSEEKAATTELRRALQLSDSEIRSGPQLSSLPAAVAVPGASRP
jgi:acid phosphatase (class A)